MNPTQVEGAHRVRRTTMSAYDAAKANIEIVESRRTQYNDHSAYEAARVKARDDAAPTATNAELMARKESGVNNKPYDHLTNTERADYLTVKEKIESRMFQDVLKLAKTKAGKDQDIYKMLGERALSSTHTYFGGRSSEWDNGVRATNFNCHSAFIIDNYDEIQELKKQLAAMNVPAVVDNREEIQELRRELAVMRSELASLKAASVLDDIDDDEDEDEIEQPVVTPTACEPKVSASRAAETRIDKENRRWRKGTATTRAVASMKKAARDIVADAREHSDRHYEQVCKDWLS